MINITDLDAMQGSGEARSKVYMIYSERVMETLTRQRAKNTSSVMSFAREQVGVVCKV